MDAACNEQRVVRLVPCARDTSVKSLLEMALDCHYSLLLSVSAALILVSQHCIFSVVLK